MKSYALEHLPPSIAVLVDEARRGEEIVLTNASSPVARIVGAPFAESGRQSEGRPQFGYLAGKIRLAPDFDEPLDDFGPYMN
jgi:prevent-host-death family protein